MDTAREADEEAPVASHPAAANGAANAHANGAEPVEEAPATAPFAALHGRAPPTKAAFGTQAGALLRKNLRFQSKNVGTNCCLVLTPLVFSVVLGVVSFLLNNLLLSGADFKCGCLCQTYAVSGGSTFDFAAQTSTAANGSVAHTPTQVLDPAGSGDYVWNPALVDPWTGNTYSWQVGQLTCGTTDGSKCGARFSSYAQSGYCPVTNPKRWAPLAQLPLPFNRPGGGGSGAADPAWGLANGTSPEYYSTPQSGGSGYKYESPGYYYRTSPESPVLVTGASRALALQLAQGMLYTDVTRGVVLPGAAFAALQARVAAFVGAGVAYDTSALGLSNATTRLTELFPLLPISPFMLGTEQGEPTGNLQKEPGWNGLALTLLVANASGCAGLNPDDRSGPLYALYALTRARVSCVAAPAVWQADADAMNAQLYSGYGQGAPGALGSATNAFAQFPYAVDFASTSPAVGPAAVFNARLHYNRTQLSKTGQPLNYFTRLNAPANRLANAFLSAALASANPGLNNATAGQPYMSLRYVRDMPTQGSSVSVDVGTFLGPLFYSWLAQMLLPVIVGQLVYEKEKNLRIMMKIQGLGDSAYIAVNYAYYFLLYFVYLLLMYFYGYVLGIGTDSLSMWTRSDAGPVVIFFVLFLNVQIAIAFLMAALFTSAKTATVFSIVYVIINGLLGDFLFQNLLETAGYSKAKIVGLELLVPFSLYRGLYEMAAFGTVASQSPRGTTDGVGITWAKLSGSGGMDTAMVIFLVEWVVLGIAAWYLDQTLASGSGLKRHPLFFLDACLRQRTAERARKADAEAAAALAADVVDAADVQAAREEALSISDPSAAFILAQGLAKTYPGQDGGPVKVACRELSVAIPRGECFGLLGPNGAGKSTAINLLIGFLTPNRGRAFVCGYALDEDLSTVYSLLGVCPQHDLLWEQLSGRDHLRFYGRLKNLRGPALEAAVDTALKGVNLYATGVGDRPCGTYSGGMKRRLSVAISLIGDPPVVFLDEPSTGLDPASRSTLWGVIREAKRQRAIVLTTHAMEEAEELCDRLGIFVDGQLRCVGNPKQLTARYGGFLILTLTVAPEGVEAAKAFALRLSPGAVLTYSLGGTLKFDLPLAEVTLAAVFDAVTQRRDELGIQDWGCTNMTLEEVFIKLARDIGAKSTD